MSRFFSEKFKALTPYVPGEQPKDGRYIKLNTNESPFGLPEGAFERVAKEVERLRLYSDPENTLLTEKVAETLGVKPRQVLMTNGSDEALLFAFMAFSDKTKEIVFPDITYGFYSVFANLHGIPYQTLPLNEDFSVDYSAYVGLKKNIVLANPNAPTGLALSAREIEEIVRSNPDNVVIVDEAYVDFGGESCVSLIDEYDNLLVTQTFSKSRSLAGGRLGMAIGNEKLIDDLKTIKYSTNPYNVNRMTAAAGYAALCDGEWFKACTKEICAVREYVKDELCSLGFTVLNSKANFLFAKTEKIDGERLYLRLKEKGILVRHFSGSRIQEYNRITIGRKEDMQVFLSKVKEILQEEGK